MTGRLGFQLHRQVLRNPNLKPRPTDLEDWAGLGPAMAHSDVVVCEKHLADLVQRDGFSPPAKVLRELGDLPDALA